MGILHLLEKLKVDIGIKQKMEKEKIFHLKT